jgi:parvulin-like peptidyl-prolyl isomerase
VKKPIFLAALALGLAACGRLSSSSTPASGGLTATPPPPSATTLPTATPVPLAAVVNGQPILLADYEAEVARYETALVSLGQDLSEAGDYRSRVLDSLIGKVLVVQAAQAAGLVASDVEVQAVYDQIVAERGGQAGFDQWLAANLYSGEQFREELRLGLLANAVQSQVAASVPAEAEQVHARQILVATREEADTILAELSAGADFATLAVNRSLDASRINGGDLGWFPAGGLTQPEVAQAAFDLAPEQISPPVQSRLGFHIVQVLERGPRSLSSPALRALQKQAVDSWRADLRAKATIEKFVP